MAKKKQVLKDELRRLADQFGGTIDKPTVEKYAPLSQHCYNTIERLIENCRQSDGSMWIEAEGGNVRLTISRVTGRTSFLITSDSAISLVKLTAGEMVLIDEGKFRE
jgi:hypothetical protein